MHVIVFLYRVCQENTREHDAHSETSQNPASPRLAIARPVRPPPHHLTSSLRAHPCPGWGCPERPCQGFVRIAAEKGRLQQEIAWRREELRLQDARLSVVAPHRRPRSAPTERLAMLEVRAARGWWLQPAADLFLLAPARVALWAQRVDEQGPPALWQLRPPVNRFPDLVRYAVQRLKTLCPTRGKVKIAQILARAGLHLSPTTVGRRLREPTPLVTKQPEGSTARVVTAKGPNHLWHLDLTIVPTVSGFGTPGVPFALPPCWRFCGWVAVASDPYSRRLMSRAVFPQKPDSRTVGTLLERVLRSVDARPKDLVCDQDKVFWCQTCKDWCRGKEVKPR